MLEVSAAMAVLGTDEADPVQGMLRVACAPSMAQTALARALPEFLRRHPRAAVDLRWTPGR
jgi:DNA-binding transcriptional LysR family regulator